METGFPISGFGILILAVLFFAVIVLFAAVKTVPQGYAYTVESFGR